MKDEVIRDLKEQTAEVIRDLRSTADVLEAIQNGETPEIQGRNPGGEWRQVHVALADDWHFLRFTPEPEELRIAANEKLRKEWERPPEEGGRFALEFFNHMRAARGEGWRDSVGVAWNAPHLEYRRKFVAQMVPWTKETCPRDAWVRNKSRGGEYRIIGINEDGACLSNFFTRFGGLLSDYEQLDGTPCGRVVE